MSEVDTERTYLVTFRADTELSRASTIRFITLAATTTDAEDARVLALSDIAEEFGIAVSKHFIFVGATPES